MNSKKLKFQMSTADVDTEPGEQLKYNEVPFQQQWKEQIIGQEANYFSVKTLEQCFKTFFDFKSLEKDNFQVTVPVTQKDQINVDFA